MGSPESTGAAEFLDVNASITYNFSRRASSNFSSLINSSLLSNFQNTINNTVYMLYMTPKHIIGDKLAFISKFSMFSTS